jgi:uncharacterized protein (TIGR00369 family)
MAGAAPALDAALLSIPEGFKPLETGEEGRFIGFNGPLYRMREGERFVMGLRVERRHCNPADICHGGMLTTFIDMGMALGANYQAKLGRFLPTITLSADFIAPAPLGCWLECRTDLLRVTARSVFAQCIVTADGVPAVRGSGIYKLGPALIRPGVVAAPSRP